METLFAKHIVEYSYDKGILSDNMHKIKHNNWNFSSNVQAAFDIGYNSKNIFLKFKVTEDYVRGLHTSINAPVYEDSCVEFFLSIEEENYYNFEVNCIGSILAEYGSNRDDRQLIDEQYLREIITEPSLGKNRIDITNRTTTWFIDVIIPISVLVHSEINTLDKLEAQCNFYKCGNKLKHPHYLSWAPIESKTINFHKPEFFKTLVFNKTGSMS